MQFSFLKQDENDVELMLFIKNKFTDKNFIQLPEASDADKTLLVKSKKEAEDNFIESLALDNTTDAKVNKTRRSTSYYGLEIPTLKSIYSGKRFKKYRSFQIGELKMRPYW